MAVGQLDAAAALHLTRAAVPSAAEVERIMGLVHQLGFALVRGLPPDPAAFEAFTAGFDLSFVPFRGRVMARRHGLPGVDASIATSNDGFEPVGWHAESSFSPLRPEYVSFFCARAPRVSGETLLCDGAVVYAALPDDLREFARETRLMFTRRAGRQDPLGLGSLLAQFEVDSVDALRARARALTVGADETFEIDIDEREIVYRYTYPLARRGRSGGAPVIATMLDGLVAVDGRSLPRPFESALNDIAYEHAYFHQWQDGDLVFVDNARVMHARNPYNDRARCVLVRFGSAPRSRS